ncbi:MAG: hypothetical protein KatS3mg115_0866 [Candidatus Poribacteria bacterium]|nr:MAG: hypothetical protein KatS3mg115_0866 [Candidatus Poribacteria bacterium]
MGFRGVKIPAAHLAAATPRIRLDDPHLMRLYEALAEAGDCVLAADLAEGATQVAELKTVATAFPELPIVLGHFGMANRPGWFSQLRLAQLPNVFIESGGLCWLFRYEEPPFEDAQEAIRIASLEVGVEKLMWGSDLPRTLLDFTYRQMLDFVREGCEFFSEEEKAQFLGGNAARVYRLSTQPRKKQGLTPITAW